MSYVNKKNRAIFFDRDGVINELVYHPKFRAFESPLSSKEFKLKKGISLVMKILKEMGFLLIVISNQPSIAKGKMTLRQLNDINKKMRKQLAKKEVYLDAIYYCLHHPDPKQVKNKKYLKKCKCRKPKPGLLFKASQDFHIDLSKSFMIGDTLNDIRAGKQAKCKTILLCKYL